MLKLRRWQVECGCLGRTRAKARGEEFEAASRPERVTSRLSFHLALPFPASFMRFR